MDKKIKISIATSVVCALALVGFVFGAIPDNLAFVIENSTDTVTTVDKLGHFNTTGNIETERDLYIAGSMYGPNDAIAEALIDFDTSCGSGNHLYVNGNDLACEADAQGSSTEEDIQDGAFSALNGTQTNINVTYDDPQGSVDFIVPDMANTTEEMEDTIEVALTNGTGVGYTYNDGANTITLGFDCSDVTGSANDHLGCSGESIAVDDDFVLTAGDTMTGNLTMDDGNITLNDGTSASVIDDKDSASFMYFDSNGAFVVHLEA